MRMIARIVFAIAAVLAIPSSAKADYFEIEVSLQLLNTGYLQSGAEVRLYNSFFWEINDTINVTHYFLGGGGGENLDAEAPYYGVLESSDIAEPPNCYRATV